MSDTENKKKSPSKLPLIISGLLIASLIVSYFTIPNVQEFFKEAYEILTSDDEERITQWVGELGFWGPLIIVLAMTLQLFLIVIPSFLLMVVAVLAYGPFWGATISVAAIFTASTIGYTIGRFIGNLFVDSLIGQKKREKLGFYVEKYGVWAVIITRLAPMLSNDAISFVGGILRMGYWKFIGATLAGIIPLSALVAYFGKDIETLKSGLIWISGISLALFLAYIIYDRTNPSSDKNP